MLEKDKARSDQWVAARPNHGRKRRPKRAPFASVLRACHGFRYLQVSILVDRGCS
jgi:hypothetical protein